MAHPTKKRGGISYLREGKRTASFHREVMHFLPFGVKRGKQHLSIYRKGEEGVTNLREKGRRGGSIFGGKKVTGLSIIRKKRKQAMGKQAREKRGSVGIFAMRKGKKFFCCLGGEKREEKSHFFWN